MKFINFFGLLLLLEITLIQHEVQGKKIQTSKIVTQIKAHQTFIKQERSEQFYKAAGIIEAWGWDEFKDWCKDSYNKTKDWAKDTYDKGKDWAKGEQKNIVTAKNEQFYKAAGIIEAWGWDEFKDWCKDSYNKTKDWAKDTYDKGKDWAKGEQKNIVTAKNEQFYKAAGIIEAWGWDEFKDWCKDSYNKTKDWAKDTYDKGKDWAKGEAKNIVTAKNEQFYKAAGIIEAWGWDEFKDWCKDSYNKTKDWAKDTYDKGKDWAKDKQKAQKLVSKKARQTFDSDDLTSEELAELEDALVQITPFLTEAFENGPETYGLVKEQVLSEIQEMYGQEGVQVVHYLFGKFEVQYISQKIEENRALFELALVLGGKEELEAIEQEYLELLTPILEPVALEEIEKFFDSIYATQSFLSKGAFQDNDSDDADADYDGSYEDLAEDFDSVDLDSELEDSDSEELTNQEEQQNDVTELTSQQILLLKEKSSGNFTILGIQMLKPSVEMQTLPWLNYLIFALALAFIIFGLYKCLVVGKNIANNQSVSKSYKLFKKETEIEEHFL